MKEKKQDLYFDFLCEKVKEKVVAYDVNCLNIFSYLKTIFKNCYYFESLSLKKHQNRYFTLGFSPLIIFSAKQNKLIIEGKKKDIESVTNIKNEEKIIYETNNPYNFLKEKFNRKLSGKSYQGGLIGFFSHEAVNYFEPHLNLKEHKDFENFKLGLYYDGLSYDTMTGTLSYYTFYKNRFEEVEKLIKKSLNYSAPKNLDSIKFIKHSRTKEEFINEVKKTKEKIKQGYSFQAEVGFKSHYEIKGDKIVIYNRLREINPSPYMFYLKFNEQELLGSSPEILISCKDRNMITTPTAGTIHRGKNEEEDIKLARTLLNDSKERAEHNMLVDLHRNDLAKVAIPSSVKISELMYIIKFSHVQHIVSNIIGILGKDKSMFDVLSTILPGGVVTGAPKIETIKIINENEKNPRGVYRGAIGRFSLSGDCDFILPIRSIFCYKDKCYAQTSAGIVYDSNPEKEFIEINNKLGAMKQTLEDLGA